MKKTTMLFLLLCCIAGATHSQTLQVEDVRAQMIKDWIRAKDYTGKYLAAMPANRYGARAVDSIRSFAEQMLHLASGNISLVSAASGEPRIFNGFNMEKSAGAQSRDSVEYYVNASYDYAIDCLKKIDAAKFGEMLTGRLAGPRWALFTKAFEHQTHHRGQATIYIRLQGIRPPAEQLF